MSKPNDVAKVRNTLQTVGDANSFKFKDVSVVIDSVRY